MTDKKPGKRGSLQQRLTRAGLRHGDRPDVTSAARPYVELLEARVLYSADPLVVLADPADIDSNDFTGELLPYRLPDTPLEIVFINDDVSDLSTLMLDLHKQIENGRRLEVHLLDSTKPGLDQIGQIISSAESIAAVHVISHGNTEGVQVGGEWLSDENVHQHQNALADWQPSLLPQASLHIYGCDLAATDNGVALLNNLAGYTGTEVLASDDKTGHASLQADWDLEFQTGHASHEFYDSLLTEVAKANWQGELAAPALGDGSLTSVNEDSSSIPGDSITNIFAGQFSSSDGSSFVGIAIAADATTSQGTWQYSSNSGVGWSNLGTVSHDTALVLDVSTLLRFVPGADVEGPVPELTIYGIDSSYTGAFSSNASAESTDVNSRGPSTPYAAVSATINSNIIAQNDAPALDDGVLRDVVVDPMNPAGETIANIFDGQFSDVDSGAWLEGIAIVADDTTTEGTWEYSTNSGNWFSIGSVSTNAALLLHESTLLRFNPEAEYIGQAPALSVYGVDETGGPYTAGGARSIEDVSVRGGSTPYAVDAATVVSSVVANFAANDDVLGPVVSGSSLNFLAEDFTDNDAIRGAQAPTIRSVTPPALGSLAYGDLNGNYVYSSPADSSGVATFNYNAMDGNPDIISQWRLTNDGADDLNQNNGTVTTDDPPGALVFDGDDSVEVPNFSYPSEFTLMFEFQVNDLDDGGEQSLFSQGEWKKPNYLSVWINDKDEDPPRSLVAQINDSTESGEGSPYFEFDVSSFENDGGAWHSFAIVVRQGVGHSIYIDGNLEFTSSRASGLFNPTGPAYFGAEENAGSLDYHLENHDIKNARLYSGFDLPTVKANQLNEFDSGSVSITVRNEETLVNNNNIEVDEDQTIPITNADLLTTDIEDGASALRYEISVDASYGKLVLNGVDLHAGDSFTQKDIDDGNLEFRHNGNEIATADSITMQVDDGAGTATTFALSITIKLENDLPVLSSMESGTLNYIEGDGAVVVSNTIAVSDADNVELTSARVEFIAGYESAEDELLFIDTASISGSFNSTLGILTLTGTGNLSAWQDALRSIQYRNSSESPEDGTRTLSFTVNDGTADSLNADRVIQVFAVNDAPDMGNASLAAVAEDTPDPDGDTVGNLFNSV